RRLCPPRALHPPTVGRGGFVGRGRRVQARGRSESHAGRTVAPTAESRRASSTDQCRSGRHVDSRSPAGPPVGSRPLSAGASSPARRPPWDHRTVAGQRPQPVEHARDAGPRRPIRERMELLGRREDPPGDTLSPPPRGRCPMRNRSNHILFIVENNDVPYDRRVWLEATTLKEAGHDVSVVCPRSQRSRRRIEKLEGVRIIRHPRLVEAARPWQYLFEYTNALFWEILVALFLVVTHHVDVVHIANPPDAAFVLGPLLRFAGARIVFDQHDMSPEIYEDKFGRRDLVWRALRWCERQSIRFADLVITPNESMKRLASERAGKDPEAVHVVRNGPKLEAATETTEDPGLRNGRQYLVTYMGIIGEQEGLDGLVRVIDDIVHVRGRTDVQFAVIGDGTGLPAVREDVRSRGLDDYVTFTGYLTGDAFMKALGSADVCVCPEPPTFVN